MSGYGGTIQASQRQHDSYASDGGRVHQMDRGEADVIAQIWNPKIWVKFSLFALHCIMTYIFKFAKLNIANIENLKREQTPPQIPKPSAIAQISKTKYS